MAYDLEPYTFDARAPAPRPVETPAPPAPQKGGAALYALVGATLGLLGGAGVAAALAARFAL